MSKQCARCEKTVYPLEELKCLDKVRLLFTIFLNLDLIKSSLKIRFLLNYQFIKYLI